MALTKVNNRMIDGAQINVLDFGATGDGTTNDTTAVQAAINASGGKPVVFNAGKTFLCTALTVTSNTHLIINGTLKSHASIGSNPLISGSTVSNVIIEGSGIVDGNKSNVGSVNSTGIYLATATNCRVQDITIQNCYLQNDPGIDGAGLWIEGGSDNCAINVTSDNHRGNGFVFGNNTDSYTQNCRASNNTVGSGIAHTRGVRAKSINDFADSNGYSNITINCEESQILYPTSRGSGYAGINIGHDSETSDASRTVLIGGVSENNDYEGVSISGSDDVTIIGVYCNNNGADPNAQSPSQPASRHGIDARNNVNGLHVIGCKVTASKNSGICIFEGTNHRIESCKFYENDRTGIVLTASDVQISDCEVFNNNQLGGTNRAGIQFLSGSTGCAVSNCNLYDDQATATQDYGVQAVAGTHYVNDCTFSGNDISETVNSGGTVIKSNVAKVITSVNVKDFGATGDGSTDDTNAIQDAINYASNHKMQTIFFPDGHYKYSVLRTYYDGTDNAGFNSTLSDGRLLFRGTGRMAISDLNNYDGTATGSNSSADKRFTGAVLESTGAGLIIDPTAQQGSSANARNFVAKDITFIANNTGQIIQAESCPGITFDHCSFKQFGAGGGLVVRNCWFFVFNQCYLFAGGSGDGISSQFVENPSVPEFGNFAGLWTITNSLIDDCANGVRWTGGQVVNLAIRDTAIQNCTSYGLYADAGNIQTLTLDNAYFENVGVTGVSFIKSDDTAIEKLYMQSCFMLGGGNADGVATAKLTGPHIDLGRPLSVDINNTRVFRPPTKFLHIENETASNVHNNTGQVRNTSFVHDATNFTNYTTPIYLVTTGASVALPFLENNIISGNPEINDTTDTFQLYDSSNEEIPRSIDIRTGVYSIPKLGLGDVTSEVLPFSPPTVSAGSSNIRHFEAQFGNRKVPLDNSSVVPDGRIFFIKSDDASVREFAVEEKNSPSTVLTTLHPGESAIFAHNVDGSSYTYVMLGKFSSNTAMASSISVTAANTPIFNVESVFGSTDIYSGVLHVIATSGTFVTTGNANLAAYVLLVTKAPGGSGVVEIAKNGLTAGSSANWPSFTFSLDTTNGQLEASPVGSTSGPFHFYVSQLGGLELEGV